MKVLIIGAGALGIGVGATLAKSGMQVDFVARGVTKDAILRDGISRKGILGDIDIEPSVVGVYDDYSKLPENAYDYVIIATKTTANEEVALSLSQNRKCITDRGVICFMQNGCGVEEAFEQYFEPDELYHCRVITGFEKTAANESKVTVHQAPVLLGSLNGIDASILNPLAQALDMSGLEAKVVDGDELSKALWSKLIYNTTLNPLGAILNMSYGELADSDYAHSIMDILIEETFEIMKAIGGETYWETADEYRTALFEDMVPKTYEHRSSTLQDIEKKQKTEIDTLTGSLLTMASNCNVSAPVHTMLYSLVKAKEEKF